MLMKSINKHNSIIMSVLINLVFFTFMTTVPGAHYELSDDWFFAENILDGYYNFTFCSYFIQVLSGLLQKVLFDMNAFIVLQVILGFIAMTSIGYIFFETFSLRKGLPIFLVIQGIFAVSMYSLITFTKTAAFLCVAGGLMMLWAYHEKKPLGYSVFGMIMVLLGSFYRFKIFYSVVAVFAVFILALIISKVKKPFFKGFFSSLKEVLSLKTVLLVVIMLVTVFGANYLSRAIIYSDDDMDYYRTYNSLRSAVVDFRKPTYQRAGDEYDKINISHNDLRMIYRWYFDDQGFADVETLEKITELQVTERLPLNEIIEKMIDTEVESVTDFNAEGVLIVAYLFLSAVILLAYKRKSWIYVSFLSLIITALYSYLWIDGRIKYRALFSIWFAAIICLLYSTRFMEYRGWVYKLKNKKPKLSYIVTATACVLFSALFVYFSCDIVVPELKLTRKNNDFAAERYIQANDDKVFALGRMAYLELRTSTELDNPYYFAGKTAFDKCLYYGSPYLAHPSYNRMLEEKGVKNLYSDLIDSDDIYFVETDEGNRKIFIKYLNEQYGKEGYVYKLKLIHKAGSFNFYKVITVKDTQIEEIDSELIIE